MLAARAIPLTLLVLIGTGCSELPGEDLGTYKVTMTLEENNCGPSAVHSLDKRRYSVQLRGDERYGYWRIAGQTPIQGKYEAPDFAFEFRAIVASAGPDSGPNGCRLQQLDQISGSLTLPMEAGVDENDAELSDAESSEPAEASDAGGSDAGSKDAGDKYSPKDAGNTDAEADVPLMGEHLMIISADPATDCRRAAVPPEGPFERLPCMVRYSLRGVPTKSF